MKNQKTVVNSRMAGLDILRVFSALVVFFFHAQGHLGCSFGILNDFFKMGAIFMTAFFMLSGFVLCHTNCKNNMMGGGYVNFL